MTTAVMTKPLRTRAELAGGDAPPVYRPRISAIKIVERRLATYFRSQIRSARTILSALDGDDLSDLSPKQIDKLLEKLVGKVKASENSERLLRRSLVGIYEGMAEASHRRGLKQARSAARKLKRAGKTIRKAQPLELSKQLVNATEWARMHAGELITDTDDVTKSWVMRAIRKGIEEGQSIQQMEDRLIWVRASWAKRQPGKQSRAEKIARTETGMAYNMGSLIGYRDSEVVEFVNVYDNKAPGSCAACAEADGQVWTVSYAMDNLLEHPNCLLPGNRVLTNDMPKTIFLRPYHGEVVILRTAGNKELSCTPNHPILTNGGWIPAGELREGDQVVCDTRRQWVSSIEPNDNEMPPTIEDLASALLKSGCVTTSVVPGAAADFHGDGFESKVHIVDINSDLMSWLQTPLSQHVSQLQFQVGGKIGPFGLDSLGLQEQSFPANSLAAPSSIGCGNVGTALLDGHVFDHDGSRLSDGAIDAKISKPSSHSCSPSIENPSDLRTGKFLTDVQIHQDIIRRSLAQPSRWSKLNASFSESGADSIGTDPVCFSDIMRRLSGFVTFDHIVHIEVQHFSGHVYNLSTSCGYYSTNAFIVKNCIRAFGAVIAEAEPEPEPVPEPEAISDKGKPKTIHDTPYGSRGASDSYIAEWTDGSKAIFKPGKEDQRSRVGSEITDEDSEVLAYRLAQLLEYDAVPETVYVTYAVEEKSLAGSAQHWVENSHVGYLVSNENKGKDEVIVQRTVMALFDQVIANKDRHYANFLEDDDGKLWAIDHGLAFDRFKLAMSVNLEKAQELGVFDVSYRTFRIMGWRGIPPAQLEAMSKTLAQWSRVSYADVEKVMLGCDKGYQARMVYNRIQDLNSEMRQILEELGWPTT